ncbi:MAG: phage head morphogenesis protein [Desulfobulbaceae bacterium]|nr:phage head morphogenesis protein [Desulfobulbaceae bacterium]
MPESAQYVDLPFEEAIAFFRAKLNLPTATWKDIWQGAHSKAFTVAGAMKEDLLDDLRAAVDQGIAQGTTLAEFRKSFDDTVARAGWEYNGGRNWRTATIFNTNLSTSYSAGRYKQQMSPAVQAVRPFLRYVPSSSGNPRPEHAAWGNLVLPADDPFWRTHYPPNGWG